MRLLLRDLSPGQQYALQFRTNTGTEQSAWSQIHRITATPDQTPPSPVENLLWFVAPKPANSAINTGRSFIATWDAPTTEASVPLRPLKDLRHYRLVISNGSTSREFITTDGFFEFTPDMNVNAFLTFQTTLTLTVYAVDMTYNESLPVSKIVDPGEPPKPAAGVLSNHYGALLFEHTGNDASGTKFAANIDNLEVHLGTTAGFTVVRGEGGTLATTIRVNESTPTQRALLTGLVNGTSYYAKVVAVSTVGKVSEASDASNSVTKTGLSGLEIEDGQIGTAQINFTARQLGGANAYYGTAFPTGGTYKQGDIFYNTAIPPAANAGKTYRHNGTTWAEDPSIGVISGLKILTNTLTADAVGTNQIIAAKANIAQGIIDDAHIDFLNANKIVAGILESSFLVTYGGVQMPAWSFDVNGNATVNNATVNGSLVLGNSSNPEALNTAASARSYNYSPGVSGWIIRGDGTVEFGEATLRGEFRTATEGRRIEVASGGFTGQIDFWAPNGQRTYIRSVTEQNALAEEALQFGVGSTATAWNTMVINMAQGGIMTLRARTFDQYASNEYRWTLNDTVGNLASSAKVRMSISKDEFFIKDQQGKMRLGWNYDSNQRLQFWWGTGVSDYMQLSEFGTLTVNGNGQDRWGSIGNGLAFRAGTPNNSMVSFLEPTNTTSGWRMQFTNNGAAGAIIKSYSSNIEVRTVNDGGFAPILASAFTVSSDAVFKNGIRELPQGEALEKAKHIKPKKFRRKDRQEMRLVDRDDPKNLSVEPVDPSAVVPEEVGFIAQEMPPEMTIRMSDGTLGVDMGQVLATLYGAFNEHIAEGESWNEENKAEIQALRESLNARLAAIEEAIAQFMKPKGPK